VKWLGMTQDRASPWRDAELGDAHAGVTLARGVLHMHFT
jgi:hypothetical protein